MLASLTISAILLGSSHFTVSDYNAVSSPTTSANNNSIGAAVSGDGTRIAFYTESTNLATGAANPCIVVFDRSNSSYRTCSSGLEWVSRPSISRDGRYVAFYGVDTAISVAYTPYVFDLSSMSTTPVTPSVYSSSAPTGLDYEMFPPSVSNSVEGTYYCTFPQLQDEQVEMEFLPRQILLWTIGTGTIVKVSKDSSGNPANANCSQPVINSDATKVAYISAGSNLIANSGGVQRVFRTTKSGGVWTTTDDVFDGTSDLCTFPSISADGSRVAYQTDDGGTTWDVWVWKSSTGTSLVQNTTGSSAKTKPSISADGLVITFISWEPLNGSDSDSDTYPPFWLPFGIVGEFVYVQRVDNSSPCYAQSYRLDGGTRRLRAAGFPCLSEDGETVVFHTPADRILDNSSYPSYSMIYYRSGASW